MQKEREKIKLVFSKIKDELWVIIFLGGFVAIVVIKDVLHYIYIFIK
jgi:hypothetical protein